MRNRLLPVQPLGGEAGSDQFSKPGLARMFTSGQGVAVGAGAGTAPGLILSVVETLLSS
ncbi:hypothetical protein PTH_1835 [Pelotomaculum thermopropionicum SI]|uniref:Uncharacterized protein n=1 Tax=Pelotomaculum thermopropionicum (strain DSM 13744 / JCM 10971 / SI) TaxID=370438 RepID=A5D158_PELTS|nr:hypothetical protein PTH_1835 [Pelotomaculum thermopropionicum SI]